jgi:hypothetical protein
MVSVGFRTWAFSGARTIDQDDRVASFRPIEADTDEQALEVARQFVGSFDVEEWHLDRKVGRVNRLGRIRRAGQRTIGPF